MVDGKAETFKEDQLEEIKPKDKREASDTVNKKKVKTKSSISKTGN